MKKRIVDILKDAIYCKIEEEEAVSKIWALLEEHIGGAIQGVIDRQRIIEECREDAKREFYQALIDHDEGGIFKWSQVLHETTIWAIQNQIVLDVLRPLTGTGKEEGAGRIQA